MSQAGNLHQNTQDCAHMGLKQVVFVTRGKGFWLSSKMVTLLLLPKSETDTSGFGSTVCQDVSRLYCPGTVGMLQLGKLVGNTQGGCKGQAWSHTGTSIGDHWGHAGGLVACVKGLESMHGTQRHLRRCKGTGGIQGRCMGGTGDPWACGGAKGSMASHVGKHGRAGVEGEQNTCGEVVRHMGEHVEGRGDIGVWGPGMA